MGPKNGIIIVGWRLQPQYNPRGHYLPIQRECSLLKFCIIKVLATVEIFVTYSMNSALTKPKIDGRHRTRHFQFSHILPGNFQSLLSSVALAVLDFLLLRANNLLTSPKYAYNLLQERYIISKLFAFPNSSFLSQNSTFFI